MPGRSVPEAGPQRAGPVAPDASLRRMSLLEAALLYLLYRDRKVRKLARLPSVSKGGMTRVALFSTIQKAVDRLSRIRTGEQLGVFVAGKRLPIGTVTVDFDAGGRRAEIGYWIARRFWGLGLATQAVRAAVARAFEAHPTDLVFARTSEGNVASQRVVEKCGFRRCEEAESQEPQVVMFKCSRDQWHEGNAPGRFL